jgi:hypothetical protein
MPSGLKRILPRVRVSADALRIPLLVAMGVTAGYFWRAAFEAGPVAQPVAPGAVVGQALPAKPPVRIIVPSAPRPSVRPRHVARRSPVTVTPQAQLAAVGTGTPSVKPSPPKKPTPRPSTPTSPPPPPSSPPSSPSSPSSPAGGSPPAASTPTVAAPATPAATRGPAAVTPPPPVVAQPTPQPSGSSDETHRNGDGKDNGDGHGKGDENRGGWGHGDKNHDHSGPKGHDD